MNAKVVRSGSWVVVAVALAVAPMALAQMPGPGGRPGASGMGGAPGRGGAPPGEPRVALPANMTELVNMRLSQLEEDLNLRANQVPQWNAYRDRVMSLLDDVRREARMSAIESTAPQRLDALTDVARNRLTATEDIADAGKALYKVLTPEQKAVADRRLALPLATLAGQDPGGEVRARTAAARGLRRTGGPAGRRPPRRRTDRVLRRAIRCGRSRRRVRPPSVRTALARGRSVRRPVIGDVVLTNRTSPASASPSTWARSVRTAPNGSTNVKPNVAPLT